MTKLETLEYHENGKPKIKGLKDADGQLLLPGPYEEYYENGVPKIIGTKDAEGIFVEDYASYWDNGNPFIERTYNWVGETSVGPFRQYYENGKPKIIAVSHANRMHTTYPYVQGVFIGSYKEYHPDGSLHIDGTRNARSKFEGPYATYYPGNIPSVNGTKDATGEFIGDYKERDVDGSTIRSGRYEGRGIDKRFINEMPRQRPDKRPAPAP